MGHILCDRACQAIAYFGKESCRRKVKAQVWHKGRAAGPGKAGADRKGKGSNAS